MKTQVIHYGDDEFGLLCRASLNPKLPRTLTIEKVTCGSCLGKPLTVWLDSPGAEAAFLEVLQKVGAETTARLERKTALEAEDAALLPQIGVTKGYTSQVVLLDGTTIAPGYRDPDHHPRQQPTFLVNRPQVEFAPSGTQYVYLNFQKAKALAESIGVVGTHKEAKAILADRARSETAAREAYKAKVREQKVATIDPEHVERKVRQLLSQEEQEWRAKDRQKKRDEAKAVEKEVSTVRRGIMMEEIDQELDAEDRGDFSHRRH